MHYNSSFSSCTIITRPPLCTFPSHLLELPRLKTKSSVARRSVKFGEQELTGANKTQDWLNSINMDAIVISDDDEVVAPPADDVVAPPGGEVVAPPAAEGNDDELPDLDEHPLPPVIGKHRGKAITRARDYKEIWSSINRKLRSGDYKESGVRFLCSV